MVLLIIAALAFSSCTLGTDVSLPSTIAIVSGDGQTAAVNSPLPDSLAVIVVGSFNEPLENVPIGWSVVAPGAGTLSAVISQTDQNGVAWTRYTAGATAGAVKIQARVSGLSPVFFDATVTP
jgi:hypothetical protein